MSVEEVLMQLVEVKNDIVKILYSPARNHILPSDFLLINDVNQKLISQIINIETTDSPENNSAFLRPVLSIDKDENLSLYNGYIPSKAAEILYINPDEILELIKGTGESIFFGELLNHPTCYVKPSVSFINDKLYIQSDRDDKTKTVIQNLIYELCNKNKKVLLIDFDGRYSNLQGAFVLKVSDNFKFPLDANGFDNIVEHDITDCSVEDSAVIQSIVLELKEYLQTLKNKYLPFSIFRNAVDDVFLSNPVSGLMLFRNKLWRYSQNKMFAEKNEDFEIINTSIKNASTVVLDISETDECWYKYALQTIMNLVNIPCYMVISLDGVDLDKKSVIGLYKKKNIVPVICTSYESKYSGILKSVCSNQLLCKPSKYYAEDEKYGEFLNKINTSSIILYGETTLYLPLLVDLKPFNSSTAEDVIDNEIKKDVDRLLSSSKGVISSDASLDNTPLHNASDIMERENPVYEDDEVLDSDLDFLDEVLNVEENVKRDDEIIEEIDETPDAITNNPQQAVYDIFSPVTEESKTEEVPVQNADDVSPDEEYLTDEKEEELNITEAEIIPEVEDVSENEEEIPDAETQAEEQIAENIENKNSLAEVNISVDKEIDEAAEPEKIEDIPEQQKDIDADENNETVENNEREEAAETEEVQNTPAETELSDYENEDAADIPVIQEEPAAEDDFEAKVETVESETVEKDAEETEDAEEYYEEEYDAQSVKNSEEKYVQQEEDDDDIQEQVSESKKTEYIERPEINTNINTKQTSTLPVYETDISYRLGTEDLPFKIGDTVYHPKHGKGVIEGFTNYSNKILFCQIEFENVGRRILDPRIAGIEKVE